MVSPLFLWNSNHLLFYHIWFFLSEGTSCHLSHLKKGSGKELQLNTLKRLPEPFQSSHPAHLQQSGKLLKVADKGNIVSVTIGRLWRLKSEQILRKLASQVLSTTSEQCFEQSTTASCCYSYQTSKTGQFLPSLFSTIEILSSRLQTVYSHRQLGSLMVS